MIHYYGTIITMNKTIDTSTAYIIEASELKGDDSLPDEFVKMLVLASGDSFAFTALFEIDNQIVAVVLDSLQDMSPLIVPNEYSDGTALELAEAICLKSGGWDQYDESMSVIQSEDLTSLKTAFINLLQRNMAVDHGSIAS